MLRKNLSDLSKIILRDHGILFDSSRITTIYLFSSSRLSDRKRSDSTDEAVEERVRKINAKIGDLNIPNGFELFDIEEKFSIDKLKLQGEMRKLQNILHPDRFVGRDELSQEMSNRLSAFVNDFYKILNHPYERGKYLLSLIANKDTQEIETSLDKVQLEGEFLARMMEIREIIDSQIDVMPLQELCVGLESEIDTLTRELNDDFASKDIGTILKKLAQLKFVSNCHSATSKKLATLGDY